MIGRPSYLTSTDDWEIFPGAHKYLSKKPGRITMFLARIFGKREKIVRDNICTEFILFRGRIYVTKEYRIYAYTQRLLERVDPTMIFKRFDKDESEGDGERMKFHGSASATLWFDGDED